MRIRPLVFLWILPLALLAAGCRAAPEPGKPVEALSAQEQRGYRLYFVQCIQCHEAYSAGERNGPTMQAVFRKPYLPSGMPANEDRVRDAIVMGRAKMPAYKGLLTPQQLDDLIAYMRTL